MAGCVIAGPRAHSAQFIELIDAAAAAVGLLLHELDRRASEKLGAVCEVFDLGVHILGKRVPIQIDDFTRTDRS